MNAKDKEIVQRIQKYSTELIMFVEDMSFTEFIDDLKTNRACVLTLEQIGENAKKLSPEFKSRYDAIPWRAMADMRNKIAHDYEGIALDIVWEVISEDIPELMNYTRAISAEIEGGIGNDQS